METSWGDRDSRIINSGRDQVAPKTSPDAALDLPPQVPHCIGDKKRVITPPTPAEKEEGFRKKRKQHVKIKKHRPKIFDESKPRRTPRSNPKREGEKRKRTTENSPVKPPGSAIRSRKMPDSSALNPQTPMPSAKERKKNGTSGKSKHQSMSCKRGISFNLESAAEETNVVVEIAGPRMEDEKRQILVSSNSVIPLVGSLDGIGMQTVSNARQPGREILNNLSLELKLADSSPNLNGDKEMIGVMNLNGCLSNSLQVYQRKLRANELIKYCRKFGPRCLSIFKRKRTKRQRATEYCLCFMDDCTKKTLLPSRYQLRSSSKQRSLFTISRLNLSSMLPTASQIEAAICDPESFKCQLSLSPLVKSKRKRSKRIPRSHSSFLQVSHSTMVESTDLELICHAEHSYKKEDPPGLEPAVQECLDLIAYTASDLESKSGSGTRDIKDCKLLDIECHPKEAFIPTSKSNFRSHAKVKLKIYPPDIEVAFQEKMLAIAQGTSKSQSNSKVKRRRLQNKSVLAERDSQQFLDMQFSHQADFEIMAAIESIIQQLENLKIDDKQCQLVVRNRNLQGGILPYQKKIVPLKKQKIAKVDLDPETIRMWNLLMERDASELPEDTDEEKKTNWEEQRELFRHRVKVFISCMHILQGDRRFSPWKGSVVDSVVGVFLTQNVSDYLSSNAFMSLAAKFPAPSRCRDTKGVTPCSQESTSNTTAPDGLNISQSLEASISAKRDKEPGPPEAEYEVEEKELGLLEDESVVGDKEIGLLEDRNVVGNPPEDENLVVEKELGPLEDENVSAKSESSQLEDEHMVGSSSVTSTSEKSTTPKQTPVREKVRKVTKMQIPDVDWEELRKTYYNPSRTHGRNLDSVDWDAVRCAPVEEIAKVIESRGMNNILAAKIKAFLERLVHDHGSIDLEWLKDVPPDKAKEFLLSIRGVGLKSTECVRLLTLGHLAFPVDTNIARIAVRLGWVPLEPLPVELQIHLLEQYPQMDAIQKYLWPRLCTLDKNILYVLHYQLITFGKVICTKKNPNCNACPLRAECRHFASAFASSRLRLRGAPERSVVIPQDQVRDDVTLDSHIREHIPPPVIKDIEDYGWESKGPKCHTQTLVRAVEILASPQAEFASVLDNKNEKYCPQNCDPIIEIPASPEPESTVSHDRDTEEAQYESEDENGIPHFRLNTEEFKRNLLNYLNPDFKEEEVSNALVALTPKDATIPAPKMKSVERLRTRHRVYILPDSHPLLAGFEQREYGDPSPYLLAIWPKESSNQSRSESSTQQDSEICDGDIDSLGNVSPEANEQAVCGTILIPCRTANKGSFPLNGTYFQVNEVFADHETSECPINVPRKLIWALEQQYLYCGSTASAIARGMDMEEIQHCFWNGFVCVRGFNRQTCEPEHLVKRFHELPSVAGKKKFHDDE
ncbi:unnamed protein product [Cuscuta epithymum]|uniref:HhH-GPD domain-containing protein n=1 Tax=Cuscuta epithymum TaxID=186058 RepID=A0AAV0FEM3_9ASTE|nr:unnamed protein product [Cuscuta epithymum]